MFNLSLVVASIFKRLPLFLNVSRSFLTLRRSFHHGFVDIPAFCIGLLVVGVLRLTKVDLELGPEIFGSIRDLIPNRETALVLSKFKLLLTSQGPVSNSVFSFVVVVLGRFVNIHTERIIIC